MQAWVVPELDLQDLISKPHWSPHTAFPQSRPVADRVFTCGGGLYLMTNSEDGEGDPVRAVGSAQSDYWAKRAWQNPPFPGDLTLPPPQSNVLPSLQFVGRPENLSFADIRNFESAQAGARKLAMVRASYRLTDGAFLYCAIHGANGITYIYASNNPRPRDWPVAIEFRLPDQERQTVV